MYRISKPVETATGEAPSEGVSLKAFQSPKMRVAKVSQVLWPVTEDFVNLRRRWPWRISKASCYSHKHSVGRESQFLRFFRGFVGLELCQSVTCGDALFSENSKSYVILEVFLWALNWFVVVACAGAVFYENLVLPCVLSIDFEGWQVQCSCYARRHNVWREPGTPWMIHHYCALLQILRRPGEAGFTDSLVAYLDNWDAHFGE